MIRRALISVADKTNLLSLATLLHQHAIQILSTGGTYTHLCNADIPALEVSEVTGFPEILSGRVKTLHPHIHAGILAQRDKEADTATLTEMNIQPIDLVVVNLYPFVQTVQQADCTLAQAIENIDIGGPTMIRAAAKNQQDVIIITDPNDYQLLADLLREHAGVPLEWRRHFAAKAFAHTAAYDSVIANYLAPYKLQTEAAQAPAASASAQPAFEFTDFFTPSLQKVSQLRHGENPHQQAAVYQEALSTQPTLANSKPLQGKPLSYNNLADADAAYQAVQAFAQPSCVIVKHANPCGVAQADDAITAYERAFACDPSAAFGGIIAFNCAINESLCRKILDTQFVEVIIAPEISAAGQALLATKPNLRVLCLPNRLAADRSWHCKKIHGGLLVQTADTAKAEFTATQVVTNKMPSETEWQDLSFAWEVVKFVKSNAIVLVKNQAAIGIGAGQMSRVFSLQTAREKAQAAGFDLNGCVLASDAFFPFKDNVELAASFGVSAIVQPGGSIKDDEVIDCANQHQLAMVFTGIRHFLH